MFKKLILVALIALGAQAQNYCADQKLRCFTAATTKAESDACKIREQACQGSGIWVVECPKGAPAVECTTHRSYRCLDPDYNNDIPHKLMAVKNCRTPCNNAWIKCDERAITAAD